MIDLSKVLLGRKPKKQDRRNLMLARYLAEKPVLPASIDWTPAVKTGWPAFRNAGANAVGDCTCASIGHAIECWSANAGIEKLVTDDDVVGMYSAVGGYNGSDPSTDNGACALNVLNYMRQTGMGGHRITAFVEVSTSSVVELKAAIAWFGGVYLGLDLPMSAQKQTGFVWDEVANDGGEWGGHQVWVPAYRLSTDGTSINGIAITWGHEQEFTFRFASARGAEAYAIISPDWLNSSGISPSGFDLSALNSDLSQIGSL